jgi:hypothetical protein
MSPIRPKARHADTADPSPQHGGESKPDDRPTAGVSADRTEPRRVPKSPSPSLSLAGAAALQPAFALQAQAPGFSHDAALKALMTTNLAFKSLPPGVRNGILGHLTQHPGAIDRVSRTLADIPPQKLALFGEILDAQECHHSAPAFATWLKDQREALKEFYVSIYQPLLGAELIDLHPPTPEQRIDQWLAVNQPVTAELVLDALNGRHPELGALSSPALQRHLIDQALSVLTRTRLDMASFVVGEIARGLIREDNKALRGIAAAALLQHALAMQAQSLIAGDGQSDKAHELAACCAADLVAVMNGAGDLGLMLSQLSKEEGALFCATLGGQQPADPPPGGAPRASRVPQLRQQRTTALTDKASRLNQLLIALNGAGRTAATGEIVQNLYLQISPDDQTRVPGLAHGMAVALAREWYPADQDKAAAEASRLQALMQGAEMMFGGIAGRKAIVLNAVRYDERITAELLARDKGDPIGNRTLANAMARVMIAGGRAIAFSGSDEDAAWRLGGILSIGAGAQLFFSDKVPAAARGQALAVVMAHPEITSASFTTDNAWLTPELAGPIAAAYTQGYATGEPRAMPGLSLDNMVGFAMGIAPTLPDG